MTKLLHIPTGEYIKFLSSIKYDRAHPENESEEVVSFEDSYAYEYDHISIEEFAQNYCDCPLYISSLNELEIIYD
jgi:hypothetical protein